MPKAKKEEETPIEIEDGKLPDMEGIQEMIKNLLPPTNLNKESNQAELEVIRHKNRMLEIKTETDGKKEVENLKFNHQLQLQRVKTAEIRRTIDRKANRDFIAGVR